MPTPGPHSSPNTAALPRGATDTHVHVFDPARFAYAAERAYTPASATVEALRACHAALGIERVVLIQPSVYGTGNACLLNAIAQWGQASCRGIAVVDLQRTSRSELQALHEAGVRGVRLNLEVQHETDPQRVRAQLEQAAAVIDLPGWCVQVHCAATLLPALLAVLDGFRVPLVLDHFAALRPVHASEADGPLRTLLALLRSGQVYVKLSAFYRASEQVPRHADLEPLARRLIEARPDRLVWGSDWPHTGGGRNRDPLRIEPFRAVDLDAHLESLKTWCQDAAALRRLLVDNAAELYGFAPMPDPHRPRSST